MGALCLASYGRGYLTIVESKGMENLLISDPSVNYYQM